MRGGAVILTVSNGDQGHNRKAPLWAELLVRFIAWKVLPLPPQKGEAITITLWRPARPKRVQAKPGGV